jgi:hypothetical protein
MSWIEDHPSLSLAGGVILLVLLVAAVSRSKSSATTNPNGLSGAPNGLQNGNLVYVPTQTTFTTINKGNTSTSTTTTTVNPGPVASPPPPPVANPIKAPGPPQPNPPATGKGLKWDQHHTIAGGETLTSIAASLTRSLRAAGMPGSQSVTWHDLYSHNTGVINATSAAHHNPIPGGPWNDVFPGESIIVPRWG